MIILKHLIHAEDKHLSCCPLTWTKSQGRSFKQNGAAMAKVDFIGIETAFVEHQNWRTESSKLAPDSRGQNCVLD